MKAVLSMKVFATLASTLMLGVSAGQVMAIDIGEIVRKSNHVAYYQGNDGKASVKMTIVDGKGRERKRDLSILRYDDSNDTDANQRFYVFFKRPADINKTAFLVWKHIDKDDDRWMYLPALDLVKRIAASDERTSFVGSHFFYEDVSGRGIDEDQHELLEETEHYYVVKSTPRDPDAVEFAYYKNWVYKASFLPVKAEYFDAANKNYRTYEVLAVENIDGFQTAVQAKMTDHRIGGHTLLEYSRVEYNAGLSDELFSERYLRKPPRQVLR